MLQARYFVSVLRGVASLPSREAMREDGRLRSNRLKKNAHFMGEDQWAYNEALAQAGKFDSLSAQYKRGFTKWMAYKAANVLRYKESNLRFLENGDVEIQEPEYWRNDDEGLLPPPEVPPTVEQTDYSAVKEAGPEPVAVAA